MGAETRGSGEGRRLHVLYSTGQAREEDIEQGRRMEINKTKTPFPSPRTPAPRTGAAPLDFHPPSVYPGSFPVGDLHSTCLPLCSSPFAGLGEQRERDLRSAMRFE